jgi:hypothetical protein
MKDILELVVPGSRSGGAGVRIDTCWIEVDLDGAIGPDFGWPAEADKLAYLGPCPRPGATWVGMLTDWLRGGHEGEGEEARWARGYLNAQEVAELLDEVLPDDPGARALKTRMIDRNRYIVFAQLRQWAADQGDGPDEEGDGAPESPTPFSGMPRVRVPA